MPRAAHPKRLTYSNGASTSPSWNPKTGQQVAFVSDRGGIPQLYTMNVRRIEPDESGLARHGLRH